jgi:hypothetical protein
MVLLVQSIGFIESEGISHGQDVEKNRTNLPNSYDAFRNALLDRGIETRRCHRSR